MINLREVFTWVEEDTALVCRGWMWGLPECHFWIDDEDIDSDSMVVCLSVVVDGFLLREEWDYAFPTDPLQIWSELRHVLEQDRAQYADMYLMFGRQQDIDAFGRYKELCERISEYMSKL